MSLLTMLLMHDLIVLCYGRWGHPLSGSRLLHLQFWAKNPLKTGWSAKIYKFGYISIRMPLIWTLIPHVLEGT